MIFAAGLGTRLKPLTDTMPKALVPIADKTLLQWQIERLRDAGITDIIVNVHHFADMIIRYLEEHDGFGCHITISDERDLLLDTGGGLRKAWQKPEPILALNVDILSNINLRALIAEYENLHNGDRPPCVKMDSDLHRGVCPQCVNLLVVSRRETQRYLCFDAQRRLTGWTNIKTGEVRLQDGEHLAFSGMQILSPTMQSYLNAMPAEKFSLIDLYLSACTSEPLLAYVPTDYRMMDVGKIEHIEEAKRFAQTL